MNRDLRVMMGAHYGGGLLTNRPVAEGGAFVTHANYSNMFSHSSM
jgi:hypothetical protein